MDRAQSSFADTIETMEDFQSEPINLTGLQAFRAGVAELFGPRAIFRNFDGGPGHTTKFDFLHFFHFHWISGLLIRD